MIKEKRDNKVTQHKDLIQINELEKSLPSQK